MVTMRDHDRVRWRPFPRLLTVSPKIGQVHLFKVALLWGQSLARYGWPGREGSGL